MLPSFTSSKNFQRPSGLPPHPHRSVMPKSSPRNGLPLPSISPAMPNAMPERSISQKSDGVLL